MRKTPLLWWVKLFTGGTTPITSITQQQSNFCNLRHISHNKESIIEKIDMPHNLYTTYHIVVQ